MTFVDLFSFEKTSQQVDSLKDFFSTLSYISYEMVQTRQRTGILCLKKPREREGGKMRKEDKKLRMDEKGERRYLGRRIEEKKMRKEEKKMRKEEMKMRKEEKKMRKEEKKMRKEEMNIRYEEKKMR